MRKVVAYTWIAVLVAGLYVGWVFYSRRRRTAADQRKVQEQKQAEADRVNKLIFGSGEVQLTTFVAEPGILRRGETAELCYGVANAVRVELTPAVEQAKPTYRHCVEIAPKSTTTYTIKATDSKGNSKSASLTVQVR
jgi:hypothetical protein